jgi:hypothetical protein
MLRNLWDRMVWKPLRFTLAEASWFSFVLNAILIAAAVNLGTSVLLEVAGVGWTLAVLILLPLLALILSNFYHLWRERQLLAGERAIADRPSPTPKAGLILMASSEKAQKAAIDYHRPRLQHVWLIVTPGMSEVGRTLEAHIRTVGAEPHRLELPNEYDVGGCYALVRAALAAARRQLLLPEDIAADMTGGTKPMTAALVLACADLGADVLEHVPTHFVRGDETVPLRPIQVTINQSAASMAQEVSR